MAVGGRQPAAEVRASPFSHSHLDQGVPAPGSGPGPGPGLPLLGTRGVSDFLFPLSPSHSAR